MPDIQQFGTAREHATASVPRARAEQTAAEVRDGLADSSFEYVGDIAVLAENALVGLLPIERQLAAEQGVHVSDLMVPGPPATIGCSLMR